MERMRTVEKDNFLEVLNKLVDLGKSKNNTLDINDINDFFKGVSLMIVYLIVMVSHQLVYYI